MTWKSYAIASGAALVATYLGSSPPPSAPGHAPAAVERTATTPPPAPAVDIQAEASRLQARVRGEIEYQEPSRNPFRYGRQARAARAPVPEPEVPDLQEVALPPVPQPPAITVAGIAATVVEGVRQRTAILMTQTGPLEVREGDAVGDYRVVRIEEDAVELATADGTRRRLSLRP
jgi:hypothetical protein